MTLTIGSGATISDRLRGRPMSETVTSGDFVYAPGSRASLRPALRACIEGAR